MVRKLWIAAVVLVMVAGVAQAELPKALEEFQARIATDAGNPQKAVKLFFDGIYIFQSGQQDLGKQCIMEMSRDKDWKTPSQRMLLERMVSMPHIYRSYAAGATSENHYEMNPNEYALVFHGEPNMKPYGDKPEGAFCKLFVRSGGADAPRSMTLQRNNAGQYKVYEFSSINLDIRPPKAEADASLENAKDPKWVMRRFFEGILLYIDGKEEEGVATITSVTTNKNITSRVFTDYMKTRPWMFGGFMVGTSPETGYQFDRDNWELNYAEEIKPPAAPGERTRALLKHSGADIPKPIYLVQDERGEYRISDYANVYSNCRLPVDPNAGNF